MCLVGDEETEDDSHYTSRMSLSTLAPLSSTSVNVAALEVPGSPPPNLV